MSAKELLREGKLTEAIDAQVQAVKAAPGDTTARIFLFELLAGAGDWERASKHLDVVASQAPDMATGVSSYQATLRAEQARDALFATGQGAPAAHDERAARPRAVSLGARAPAGAATSPRPSGSWPRRRARALPGPRPSTARRATTSATPTTSSPRSSRSSRTGSTAGSRSPTWRSSSSTSRASCAICSGARPRSRCATAPPPPCWCRCATPARARPATTCCASGAPRTGARRTTIVAGVGQRAFLAGDDLAYVLDLHEVAFADA